MIRVNSFLKKEIDALLHWYKDCAILCRYKESDFPGEYPSEFALYRKPFQKPENFGCQVLQEGQRLINISGIFCSLNGAP